MMSIDTSSSSMAPLDLDEHARLRAEIDGLSKQVRQLIRTESALYQQNQAFDAQVKIYRRLSDIGHQFNGARSAETIADLAARFIVYELNFERFAVFFRESHDSARFKLMRLEGYYDRAVAQGLEQLILDESDPRLSAILREGQSVIVSPEVQDPGLQEIGAAVGMDEFLAYPIGGEPGRAMGLLFSGNTSAKARYQTRVEAGSNFAIGLTNLVNEATIALNNVRYYQELEQERKLLEIKVEERTLALQTAYEDLKKLDELKTRFFANVSHELRTPLTLSIGPLDLLTSDASIPPSAQRNLEVLRANQHRLLRLINDLLDFSKLEAGRMTARFCPILLIETLKEYVTTLEGAARSRGISLSFETSSEDIELYVDRGKFEKIAMNLLSNAFKFTPNGGRIDVRVHKVSAASCADTPHPSGEGVRIDISDTGIGIAPENLAIIFDRFSQVDASTTRKYSGTGIGLALVKEFMELHGGYVDVESKLGEGSTFSLYFRTGTAHLPSDALDAAPTADVIGPTREALSEFLVDDVGDEDDDLDVDGMTDVDQEVIDNADERRDAPDANDETDALITVDEDLVTGAKVVVVDDTPSLRKMLCRILRPTYRVYAAEDGLAGLELCRRIHPDLVISDMMMPRMSGIELCEAIKAETGSLARTPVILVTARADMSSKLEGLEHGADDYLAKPFNVQELLARCRNIIRLRKQEQRIGSVQQQVLKRDLALAGAVQSLMLPEGTYTDETFDIGAMCQPASVVGGDWWWYGLRRDGSLLTVIGDVTSHGAGPAMVAATAIGTCRTHFQLSEAADVGQLLALMNHNILDVCNGDYWLSLAALDLNPALETFRVWRAGAPPPMQLIPGEAMRPVGAPGTLVGDVDFQPGVTDGRYVPGQRFALFTDGAYDFRMPSGRAFGLPRLLRLIEKTRHEPPSKARDAICTSVAENQRTNALEDDLTLVLIDAF
ncbi:MAG: response regulator [Deltaproteobacteria bacterium]|nr:response regulator [Deltaproteobacteria bacterium]